VSLKNRDATHYSVEISGGYNQDSDMPRMSRVIVPGVPHHVTQRGNRREDIFFTDEDRQRYLQLLLEYSCKHGLKIVAYCLMTNHVHLVCVPGHKDSLALVFRPLDLRYTQHYNRGQGITGRLWQGRPFSCPLDEDHLWAAIRYVERNPVRARMVRKAENYAWSSASAHCGMRNDPLLSAIDGHIRMKAEEWSAWLTEREDESLLATIRLHTRTGRPAGNKKFIAAMESLTKRNLEAKSIGRPKKERRKGW
jgi:putative transposase